MNTFVIDIAKLMRAPTGASDRHEVQGDVTGLPEGVNAVSPFRASVLLTKLEDTILAVLEEGAITVKMTCGRCLTTFGQDSTIHRAEKEFVLRKSGRQEDTPADIDQETVDIDHKRHHLHLGQFIHEELYLLLSPTPLCRTDCKGLCHVCGKDLNEGACGHESATKTDPSKKTDVHQPMKDLKKIYMDYKKR